jgi:hypothetical protein
MSPASGGGRAVADIPSSCSPGGGGCSCPLWKGGREAARMRVGRPPFFTLGPVLYTANFVAAASEAVLPNWILQAVQGQTGATRAQVCQLPPP